MHEVLTVVGFKYDIRWTCNSTIWNKVLTVIGFKYIYLY